MRTGLLAGGEARHDARSAVREKERKPSAVGSGIAPGAEADALQLGVQC